MAKVSGLNTPFKDHLSPVPGPKDSKQGTFNAPHTPSGSRTQQGIGEVQIDTTIGKGGAPAMKKG